MLVQSKRWASIDIRDIALIEAVHSTGSLSKACVELSISQPTLSKRVARLRSTLGAELFFRYSTGLVATQQLIMCLRNHTKRALNYAI